MSLVANVTGLVGRHRVRFLRYSGVAAFNVLLGQMLLVVFYAGFDMSGVAANLGAAAIGAAPAYLLNRYWVWEKHSRNHFWGEIVPFWMLMLVAVALSTVAVHIADKKWDNVVAVLLASLVTYGVVWVIKYFVLDSFLFKPSTDAGSQT